MRVSTASTYESSINTLQRRQQEVAAVAHHALRQRQRAGVAGEGARRAAEDVARELVEHDDLRQPCRAVGFWNLG